MAYGLRREGVRLQQPESRVQSIYCTTYSTNKSRDLLPSYIVLMYTGLAHLQLSSKCGDQFAIKPRPSSCRVAWLLISRNDTKRVSKSSFTVHLFILRTRRYLAGHELNLNRGVKPGTRGAHSMLACHMCVRAHEDSQSPNLRSPAAMYLLICRSPPEQASTV